MYVYTCIHTYICVYMCIYVYMCVYASIHIRCSVKALPIITYSARLPLPTKLPLSDTSGITAAGSRRVQPTNESFHKSGALTLHSLHIHICIYTRCMPVYVHIYMERVYGRWCIAHGIWQFPRSRGPHMVCVYKYMYIYVYRHILRVYGVWYIAHGILRVSRP